MLRRLRVLVLICALCALSWGCGREPAPPSATPSPASDTSAPTSTPTPTATPVTVATTCAAPRDPTTLSAPSAADGRDLDLQFRWRAARSCQDLHPLEKGQEFGPLEKLAVRNGEGHRVLMLLPSLAGAISVARYRIDVAADTDVELVAWVTLEEQATAHSDGVEFAVDVSVASDTPPPVPGPALFERLTRAQAEAGWREVRLDLSSHRGKTIWLTLASREDGNRSGDWLLWGDPRVIVRQPATLRIDLGAGEASATRDLPGLPPWSEANVFKAYSGFNEEQAKKLDPKWARRMFPWLDALRLFASLGASWGPTLARDYEAQMGHNPTRDSRGERHWAEYYEFFRDGRAWKGKPIAKRFDWKHFDALLARVASTGVRLHVNLPGAPELFTGGQGHYHTYHFNEMPVLDEAGWKAYVGAVFRHLAKQPWFARAEFSFFSEPNCRWVAADGTVRNFGYQGDAAQYARQYLWTWQAMKPYVKPGQVHLGPFVVEPDPAVPAIDNLPEFLRLLRAAFVEAGESLPPWSAFAFNIYETPQLAIDHFASYKIDYVRRLLPVELPGSDLALRFDEVGIHPLIAAEFAAAGVSSFEGSRWSAAWHAEMLALLVEQRIAVGSPWLHNEMQRPYASYALLSLASGAFVAAPAPDGALALVRPRVPGAKGTSPPSTLHVRLGSASPDRIGYLWSAPAGDGVTRLALWQFPRFPASDERLASDPSVTRVRVQIPGCADARCKVTLLGYDDQVFAELSGQPMGAAERVPLAAIRSLPALRRVELPGNGELELGLHAGEVYLLEATHADPAP